MIINIYKKATLLLKVFKYYTKISIMSKNVIETRVRTCYNTNSELKTHGQNNREVVTQS